MTTATYFGGIVLVAMIIWPIIVNSQPGTKYVALGIDWKADNLDGTLFWTAIILMILGAGANTVEQSRKEKLELKIAQQHNFRSGV